MKRIVSLLLCLSMLASVAVFTTLSTSAEEVEESAGQVYQVPQITVTTENGNGPDLLKEDGYVNARIVITDTDGSVLEDDVQFKVRGNTSAFGPTKKKPFTFKFAKKKEVLGMGKGKKWALIADAYDPTLLRNYTALHLAADMGLPYVSKQRISELWLDGSYRGTYTVTVPVQAGADRINIDDNYDDSNIKDFLVEIEATRVDEGATYFTSNGLRFVAQEPDEPDEAQLAYIQEVMDDITGAIMNGTREDIEAKIDMPSFVAYYVFNEFVKTVDLDFSSAFFFYKDGKLYAGPPWDYDFAMAGGSPTATPVYRKAALTDGPYANDKQLFKYLCKQDWFMEQANQVYQDNYSHFYNVGREGGFLDTNAAEYADVFNRNFTKTGWKVSRWWINYARQPLPTYQENLDFLKNWCSDRALWMTSYFKPFKGEYLIGDADGNGEVDITDATWIQRIESRIHDDPDGMFSLRGDIELNGLDVVDATWIQKREAMIEIPYSIGVPRTYEENNTNP